ncbi:ParA family protein [Burkholderia cepacia]|uniref:ParA family protein n=1 Tax=Burkholderia cepacia TaxID=292 RepID=UPI003EDEFA04
MATTVDTVRRMADRFEIAVAREAAGTKTRLFSLENIFAIAHHRAATRAKATRSGPIVVTTYASMTGAGSTTLASNIGVLLALRGFRTLLVDLDRDAGLTRSFGYRPDMTVADLAGTSLDRSKVVDYHFGDLLFSGNTAPVVLADVLKLPYGDFGPHLLPSDLRLFHLDALKVGDERGHRNTRLHTRTFVEGGRSGKNPHFDISKYDVVLFDAPPTISGATLGVFDATDYLVSPVSVDGCFEKALQLLSRLIEGQRDSHDRSPELTLIGNRFSLQRIHMIGSLPTASDGLAQAWLRGGIPYLDVLHDSDFATAGIPIVLYAPAEPGALDLTACVDTLLERFSLSA